MKKITLVFFLFVFLSGIAKADDTLLTSDTIFVTDSLKVRDNHPSRADMLIDKIFNPNEMGLSNADSLIKVYDDLPSFGIYKSNYIVTGTSLRLRPDEDNSDAKFQISFMQRLTNSILPFRTYLFLTYTQLAFWDIYQESFPFRDINFNPTIGLGKVLTYRNRLLGVTSFQLEHESNGKDGEASRSWNKISMMAALMFHKHWNGQIKLWVPLVDGENNTDLVSKKGWGHMGLDYNNRRINVGLLVTKRSGNFFDANVALNFSYKLFKNENQHLFLELYNGYGEGLLDYNRYHNRIRIGFVIMPGFLRLY